MREWSVWGGACGQGQAGRWGHAARPASVLQKSAAGAVELPRLAWVSVVPLRHVGPHHDTATTPTPAARSSWKCRLSTAGSLLL